MSYSPTAYLKMIGVALIALTGACSASETELSPTPSVTDFRDADAPDYLTFATEDEANTTQIFSQASPAVVFVTNKALRRGLFSLNVEEIPRGSVPGLSGIKLDWSSPTIT